MKNHATNAALTNRKPKAASEIPIITKFGVVVSSLYSAGINSSPNVYTLKNKMKIKKYSNHKIQFAKTKSFD